MVEVEVGRRQVQFQEVLPPGQVQGSGHGGRTLPLFQEVGDVFTTVSLGSQGIVQGAGDFVRAVELAQGHDLLDVVRSVEPFFLELARVPLRLRPQAQEVGLRRFGGHR